MEHFFYARGYFEHFNSAKSRAILGGVNQLFFPSLLRIIIDGLSQQLSLSKSCGKK